MHRSLLAVRSQYGLLDGGVRVHVVSKLIRETINCGKSMLASSIMGSDDLSDLGIKSKEGNIIMNFIQKDRLLGAVCYFSPQVLVDFATQVYLMNTHKH